MLNIFKKVLSPAAFLSSALVSFFGHAIEDVAHLEEKLEVRLRLLVKGAGLDIRKQDSGVKIIPHAVLARSSHVHDGDEPLADKPRARQLSCRTARSYGPRM